MKNLYEGSATYLYTGNVASTAADTASIDTIAAGSVAFCTEDGKVEKSAITTGMVRIAQKLADGTMIFSPYFDRATLKNINGESYSQATDQITFVGYNGSSGAMDAVTDTYYSIDTEWLNTQGVWNATPFRFSAGFKSTTASQKDIALGLVNNGNATMSRQPYKFIRYEATGDAAASVDITGSGTIAKLTKDLKSVGSYIKTGDATDDFTASTSSVTDATVLNIPSSNGRTFSYTQTLLGTGAGSACTYIGETSYLIADQGTAAQNAAAMVALINAGTQATAAVSATSLVTITYNEGQYFLPPLAMETADDSTWTNVVVSILTGDAINTSHLIDGTTSAAATFDLDQPYLGPTGYLLMGVTEATMVGTVSNTNWGVKMTGQDDPKAFNPVNENYEKTKFKVFLETFSTATETTTGAVDSSTQVKSIAQQEVYSQFLDKDPAISAYPATNYRGEVSLSNTYDICSFDVRELSNVSSSTGIPVYKTFSIKVVTKESLDGDYIDTVLAITV